MFDKLIGPITGIIGKIVEDKDQRNALAHEIATMSEKHALELAKGQLSVNATEAAHKSLFVAGWRPARVDLRLCFNVLYNFSTYYWHLGCCTSR